MALRGVYVGAELVEAVESHITLDRAQAPVLTALARALAQDEYTHWLDCGHGPSPSKSGPVIAIVDGKHICRECAVSRELAAISTDTKHTGYLSSDGAVISTAVGGILAHVSRTWKKSCRTYWQARDDSGVRWHGSALCPGAVTTMLRNHGRGR